MGWSSGTEIFDVAVRGILKADAPEDSIRRLYDAMKDKDWDCESDSEFWGHPLVGPIIGNDELPERTK